MPAQCRLSMLLMSIGVATTLAMPGAVAADPYPEKTVEITVPIQPGGGADLNARLLAQGLSDHFDGNFIVLNKPGAGGILGARGVSAAAPDGYSLLFAASAMTMGPYLVADLSFDTEAELTPITEVASGALVMVVNPSIPANTPAELAAYAKEHPDTFRWGGTLGSPDYFSIAKFNQAAGIKPVVVPFNGAAPTLVSLLSGEISAAIIIPSLVKEHIGSGKLRALAVTSKERNSLVPDIPTVASFGYDGFDSSLWYGLWGPKDMPLDVATTIQGGVAAALQNPQILDKLAASGLTPSPANTPEQFKAFVAAEVAKNVQIIEENNLKEAK